MTLDETVSQNAHLLEEGAAAAMLHGRERLDVIVIGGGQAGLAVGQQLAKSGLRFAILDAHPRIGDAWRKRWDSLRLFTPAKFDSLPGMRFPAPGNSFPTKDEMADYLEAYAARFQLPVRTGLKVDRLFRRGARYVVRAGARELEADQVVVAMAHYQRPRRPPFADQLSPEITQIHSSDYRNLEQLRPGPVLLAGAGNSGAELAMEMARAGRPAVMAGPDTGEAPFEMNSFLGRAVLARFLLRFVFHRVLTVRTPMGRKMRPRALTRGVPLIRVKGKALATAQVERTVRVVGARDGKPLLEDGRVLDVANVIWCTGFHPGFAWIDLPIFGENKEPLHEAGVVTGAPGLYFVGLGFLYAMSSSMIHGVGRDAARIVKAIRSRATALARAPRAETAPIQAASM